MFLLIMFLMVCAPHAHAEGDVPAKAKTCIACHGPAGHSNNEEWPSLAGQGRRYLVRQLEEFRSGARVNPLMTPVAQMLSDKDIAELAAYFSAPGGRN